MKRPLIGARDFEAFIGQGEQAQGRSWRILCVCGKEKKRRMKCEEGSSSYVWRGVHAKGCARIKHGRKLCVASTCSKASRFLVQLVVPIKSTVGFVSNLNQL
jgi:hypothetical protein